MVEIEKLPLMGKPESIKTARQGRIGTLKQATQDQTKSEATKSSDGQKRFRGYRNPTIDMTRILCNRILKFPKTREYQKEICQKWLDMINNEEFGAQSLSLAKKIAGINRTLFKMFKEYRKI